MEHTPLILLKLNCNVAHGEIISCEIIRFKLVFLDYRQLISEDIGDTGEASVNDLYLDSQMHYSFFSESLDIQNATRNTSSVDRVDK